jgi:hypothetical protein
MMRKRPTYVPPGEHSTKTPMARRDGPTPEAKRALVAKVLARLTTDELHILLSNVDVVRAMAMRNGIPFTSVHNLASTERLTRLGTPS